MSPGSRSLPTRRPISGAWRSGLPSIRTANLTDSGEDSPRIVWRFLPPLAILCAPAMDVYLHWQQIPERYAIHSYSKAAKRRVWLQAARNHRHDKQSLTQVEEWNSGRSPIGTPIYPIRPIGLASPEMDKAVFAASEAESVAAIENEISIGTRYFIQCRWAEAACLLSVSLAIVLLVWLALVNF